MIPKSAEEIPELKEAYTQASMNTWSQGELDVYEYWQIRDAAERYSLEQQYDTGKINGKIEGKIEGKFETAVEMLQDGELNDKIKKYTGLTDREIDGLRG
jgi:predicted transposase/invertase (TIGR01784 family)